MSSEAVVVGGGGGGGAGALDSMERLELESDVEERLELERAAEDGGSWSHQLMAELGWKRRQKNIRARKLSSDWSWSPGRRGNLYANRFRFLKNSF